MTEQKAYTAPEFKTDYIKTGSATGFKPEETKTAVDLFLEWLKVNTENNSVVWNNDSYGASTKINGLTLSIRSCSTKSSLYFGNILVSNALAVETIVGLVRDQFCKRVMKTNEE